MHVYTHLALQALGFLVDTGSMMSDVVPVKYKPYLFLAVSLVQAGLAWYNHYFNPDGTPVTVAYAKP